MHSGEQLALGAAEQDHLPGLSDAGTRLRGPRPVFRRDSTAQLPLLVAARELSDEWPLRPVAGRGQLQFGAEQLELQPAAQAAVQLSLIDDPPPWEMPDPIPAKTVKKGRLARKRSKSRTTPGQTSLF